MSRPRSWTEELRDENLDIAAEKHEAEEAELATAEETEGEFCGYDDEDPNLDRDNEDPVNGDPMPEPYENDLEEFGNNEAWADMQAEMASYEE